MEKKQNNLENLNLFDENILNEINILYKDFLTEKNIILRPLNRNDFKKGYINILNQLTDVGEINQDKFELQFNLIKNCQNTYYIIVLEDLNSNQIIGSATLHIEFKFIHSTCLRGRMEDVVVDNNYRGKNLGKILVKSIKFLAKKIKCYKLSLDCKDVMIDYYKLFDFVCEQNNSNTMVIRF